MLAATVYADSGDPQQLCVRAADGSVQAHLLAEFLPASVRLHPREPGRYDTQAVQRWLGLIADHLRTMPSAVAPMPWSNGSTHTQVADPHPPAAPDRDIVRHRLWLLAGPRRVRLIHLAVCTALVALAAVGFRLLASLTKPAPRLPFIVGAAVVVCLWGLLQWSQPWPQPRKLVPYRRLGPGDSCLVTVGMLAALFASLLSIVADMTQRIPMTLLTALGVVTSLVMLTSTAFLGKATTQPADPADRTVSDPRLLLRGDFVSGLLVAMVFGLVVGAGAGVTMGASYGVALGVVSLCAVILVANAWTRYIMLLLCTRRLLPWRLGTFLDWAYRGGLLRVSGNAYQFRHRELQDWLASQSETSPRDSGRASIPR